MVAGGATSYLTFAFTKATNVTTGPNFQATESQVQMMLPVNCTLSNFAAHTTGSQPADGALVLTVRKNGVDTALVINIAANSAGGNFSDSTHTVACSANDLISFSGANASPATSSTGLFHWAIMATA